MTYDPATRWDKTKALIHLVALLGIILALTVAFCIHVHGMS